MGAYVFSMRVCYRTLSGEDAVIHYLVTPCSRIVQKWPTSYCVCVSAACIHALAAWYVSSFIGISYVIGY